MSGVFGQWQPAYAEAGIASFPVDSTAKKPAVGNYLLGGLPASLQWARRFPDANGLGFACGPRNKITVVDIDAPGEGLLADVLDRLGPTPIVVQTASGKHHAWYLHNGEGRKIRAAGFSGPVDILGKGYAIAPPSRANGGEYRFLKGSLADVAALPVIAPERSLRARLAALEPSEAASVALPVGRRNETLWRACMTQAGNCSEIGQLAGFADELNASASSPLSADEVGEVVKKVWAKTLAGQNWFGEGQRLSLPHADMDALLALGADASHLEMLLRRHHWGRDFVIANALAERMPGGKWHRKRLAAARSALLHAGRLVLLRPASRATGPALYRFS